MMNPPPDDTFLSIQPADVISTHGEHYLANSLIVKDETSWRCELCGNRMAFPARSRALRHVKSVHLKRALVIGKNNPTLFLTRAEGKRPHDACVLLPCRIVHCGLQDRHFHAQSLSGT